MRILAIAILLIPLLKLSVPVLADPVADPVPQTVEGAGSWRPGFTLSGLGGGIVTALARDSQSRIYAGGNFTTAGDMPVQGVAMWDGSNWQPLGALSFGLYGSGSPFAVDDQDNLYAGGSVGPFSGASPTYLVRWDWKMGTWNYVAGGVNGQVIALAYDQAQNVLYVGGNFTLAGTLPVHNIARLDLNTYTWSGLDGGVDGGIFAIAPAEDGSVYVGGMFRTAGEGASQVEANYIARWSLTAGWSALGSGFDNWVSSLAYLPIPDGGPVLYAGGVFSASGSTPARTVATWDGTAWSGLQGGTSNNVYSLALAGSTLYIGGAFDWINIGEHPQYAPGIAKWENSQLSPVGTGTRGRVNNLMFDPRSLQEGGPRLIIAGEFQQAGDIAASNIVSLEQNETRWVGLPGGNPLGLYKMPTALAHDSIGRIYAGGRVVPAGENLVNGVAWLGKDRWNVVGVGLPGNPEVVSALAFASDDSLYTAGIFVNGQTSEGRVWRWDRSSGTWTAFGERFNDAVLSLAVDSGGMVYAAGRFTCIGGDLSHPCTPLSHIARWNKAAGEWVPLTGAPTNGDIYQLAFAPDGSLYVSGYFSFIGGQAANNVARWNGAAWSTLGTGIRQPVYALAADMKGQVFAAYGFYNQPGGINVWDGAAWQDLLAPIPIRGDVTALTIDRQGRVFVAAGVEAAGTSHENQIAFWDGRARDPSSWHFLDIGPDNNQYSCGSYPHPLTLTTDNRLTVYVGGCFNRAGNYVSHQIAAWSDALRYYIPLANK